MGWIISDSARTEALVVKNAPSLDHAIAVEAHDSSVGIKVRGDRIPEARPLVLEVGIHEADYGQALAKLKRILDIARDGGTIRYTEGLDSLERAFSGLKAYEATRLLPIQGLIEARLTLLPTGPYWSGTLGSRVVWAW